MKAARVTLRGREPAVLQEKEAANGAAEKLAVVEATARAKAVADEDSQQRERIRKEGIRPGTPEKQRRFIEQLLTENGKK